MLYDYVIWLKKLQKITHKSLYYIKYFKFLYLIKFLLEKNFFKIDQKIHNEMWCAGYKIFIPFRYIFQRLTVSRKLSGAIDFTI